MNDSECNHRFEVSSPIDTLEVCVKCGARRECEPMLPYRPYPWSPLSKSCATFTATIFIGGSFSQLENYLRGYVMKGRLCVSIEPCKFVYTGGCEDGARIGLINYPRFPQDTESLKKEAIELTSQLIDHLNQLSASIVFPDETQWLYRPDKQKSRIT